MKFKNNPKGKKTNIVVQNLENEVLVYNLKTNQAYCLNQTSSLIWQFCDGNKSIADISLLMSEKLKTHVSEDFILLAISEFQKNNLIENKTEIKDYFAGLSRREIIKRVGLSTMIALPIISSIVAPTATNAQSGACLGNNEFVSCDTTGPTCFPIPFLGLNAWRCDQPLCCSGTCVNADWTIPGLTACD